MEARPSSPPWACERPGDPEYDPEEYLRRLDRGQPLRDEPEPVASGADRDHDGGPGGRDGDDDGPAGESRDSPHDAAGSTPDDRFLKNLLAAGVPVVKVRLGSPFTSYLVDPCPCCRLPGRFWRSDDGACGYKCPGGKRTWEEARRLWGAGGEPEPEAPRDIGRFFMTVRQARARAALRPQIPFVPNYAEFGALTLLSGLPGCGKSELVIMMVYCSVMGVPFLGMDLPRAHFILFDPENLLSVTLKRIDALFGQDVADELGGRVTIIDKEQPGYPAPLTPEFVEAAIGEMRGREGDDANIVVVIDTFRTSFNAHPDYDENGPEFASKTLGALKAVAGRTRASLWVLHHNNWSGRISGSTAFRGNADYACEYRREQGTNRAELDWIRGRGCEQQPTLVCVRDPSTKLITLDAARAAEDEDARRERHETYLRNIVVGACPLGDEQAETKAQIIRAVKASLDGVINLDQSRRPIQIGENKVRQIIDWLAERCYLGVLPGSNPNQGTATNGAGNSSSDPLLPDAERQLDHPGGPSEPHRPNRDRGPGRRGGPGRLQEAEP